MSLEREASSLDLKTLSNAPAPTASPAAVVATANPRRNLGGPAITASGKFAASTIIVATAARIETRTPVERNSFHLPGRPRDVPSSAPPAGMEA